MSDRSWFIRSRGRVLGPFTAPQLEAMRARGQFARFYQVSEDRLNWESAATLTDLFPTADGGSRARAPHGELVIDEPAPSAISGPSEGWHYAVGDHREGPISFDELQRKASRGEIQPDTLVWNVGMADWTPCRTVAGLIFPGAPPGRPSGPADPGPQAPSAPRPTRTSGLAIASLVLGLLWLSWVGSLLAIIFGRAALAEISQSRGTVGGRGMAVTGVTLGIIALALPALAVLFIILARMSM